MGSEVRQAPLFPDAKAMMDPVTSFGHVAQHMYAMPPVPETEWPPHGPYTLQRWREAIVSVCCANGLMRPFEQEDMQELAKVAGFIGASGRAPPMTLSMITFGQWQGFGAWFMSYISLFRGSARLWMMTSPAIICGFAVSREVSEQVGSFTISAAPIYIGPTMLRPLAADSFVTLAMPNLSNCAGAGVTAGGDVPGAMQPVHAGHACHQRRPPRRRLTHGHRPLAACCAAPAGGPLGSCQESCAPSKIKKPSLRAGRS